MKPEHQVELLKLMWRRGGFAELPKTIGGIVYIRQFGEFKEDVDRFVGAEIIHDEVVYRGDVVISSGSESLSDNYENCILQVVPFPTASILKYDGTVIAQAILKPPSIAELAYESLLEDAKGFGCARHIARMESHQRVALFTRLMIERLKRKYNDVMSIFEECHMNWNQTMYTMLLRTMGDSKNKGAFTELARRVSYIDIARERDSILYIESMLLGASGMLEVYEEDNYTRDLKKSFKYLQRKYDIKPMVAGEWNLYRIRVANHPVLRMAQLAGFLATRDFMFDKMLQISTVEQMHKFFRAEASQYWSTHSVPGAQGSDMSQVKRVGAFKSEMLGINLIVPMMFAYGEQTSNESYKEKAIELLEKIDRERNSIVDGWYRGGVEMESAFDSQAILQLNNEYCNNKRCWQCSVGRQFVYKTLS